MSEYKMFVWKGVLRDYTGGMIVIHAKSLDEAFRIAREKQKDPKNYTNFLAEMSQDPLIIEEDGLEFVYGGG